jgi:hypothetical protein
MPPFRRRPGHSGGGQHEQGENSSSAARTSSDVGSLTCATVNGETGRQVHGSPHQLVEVFCTRVPRQRLLRHLGQLQHPLPCCTARDPLQCSDPLLVNQTVNLPYKTMEVRPDPPRHQSTEIVRAIVVPDWMKPGWGHLVGTPHVITILKAICGLDKVDVDWALIKSQIPTTRGWGTT